MRRALSLRRSRPSEFRHVRRHLLQAPHVDLRPLQDDEPLTDWVRDRTLSGVGDDPFEHQQHRPWPLPRTPWVMRQRWEDLLFAHWRCSSAALRALVPAALDIDVVDGDAWIGVVPFRMSGVGLRGVPGVPGARAFPELNVRTYVRHRGTPGVWFFSLDAASPLAVTVARMWFHLPYFRAEMRVSSDADGVRYSSGRRHAGAADAAFDARYGPSGPVTPAEPGSLAHWLTERYCLFAAARDGRLWRGDIHHAPWPLQPAWAQISVNTMAHASGVELPAGSPLLHFARRLDVRLWAPSALRSPS
jgi:uncharacterized protein